EVVQPYMKNWLLFRCPNDPNANDAGITKDPNTGASDYAAPQDKRQWDWGWRADLGYNMDWLSYNTSPCTANTISLASQAKVARPAHTILLVDSIWNLIGTAPDGGGNWAIDAPAWPDDLGCYLGGWNIDNPTQWNQFGGAWPWHKSRSMFNVAY